MYVRDEDTDEIFLISESQQLTDDLAVELMSDHTHQFTFSSNSTGSFAYTVYFELVDYQTLDGAAILSLENSFEIIVEKETAPPYFMLAPSSSYLIEPGSTLDLIFEVQDDEPNDYTIEIGFDGDIEDFTTVTTSVEQGYGLIMFLIAPPID